VKTEHFCPVVKRKLFFDEIDVVLSLAIIWYVVFTAGAELVVWLIDHVLVVVIFQNRHNAASVLRVCDSTTVVCLCDHVGQGLEWNFFIEVQESN